MLQIDVISIFPEYLSPLKLSLLGKAQDKGLVSINIHDLRDQTNVANLIVHESNKFCRRTTGTIESYHGLCFSRVLKL